MADALNQFLNAATADTIRATNQFEIEVNTGDEELNSIISEHKLMMFGQNFTIPSRGITFANVSYKGYEMQNLVPVSLTMDQEHTVTMLGDVNGLHRRFFLAWMNKTINADIQDGSLFEGDRGVKEGSYIRLKLFQKDNKTISEIYEFFNVTISNVGTTSLDYSGGDAEKFEVQFKSTYWRVLTQNGSIDNSTLANQV